MSNVIQLDPEDFMAKSKGRLFEIYLVTNKATLCWLRSGFANIEIDGFASRYILRREQVSEAYYNALRMAKEEASNLYDGSMQIIELPFAQ